MQKKVALLLLILLLGTVHVRAVEGMWLPVLLKQLNEKEMKSMGMRISAEDLYSINSSSLKDAVFLFGGGCTAEMVSASGLMLTNHHCGLSMVQSHSSLQNDYLKNGFWAKNYSEELPNKGLTATRIVRMENVTETVMQGALKDDGTADESVIEKNSAEVVKQAVAGTHYTATVKAFYYGNEYYLFVTETFTDVRLVGAPPNSIGQFGGDADNWMWPRHNGDFAVFRIYANKDNKPSEYSDSNVPYKPLHHFPVSMKGVKPGDFTMVYGFPGRTQEYLPSHAVALTTDHLNPLRIAIRTTALEIIDESMRSSDDLRIKYTAKQQRISNAWKKWIGETRGLKKLDAVRVKQEFERKFQEAVKSNSTYAPLMGMFAETYKSYLPSSITYEYYSEFLSSGAEIFRFTNNFVSLVSRYEKLQQNGELDKEIEKLKAGTEAFFKNYDLATDKRLMTAVVPMFADGVDKAMLPPQLLLQLSGAGNDYGAFTESLYGNSVFPDKAAVLKWLDGMKTAPASAVKQVEADPVFLLTKSIYDTFQASVEPGFRQLNGQIQNMMRLYMKGMLAFLPKEKRYYPDANSTLRVSYGKVEGYAPRNGVTYDYYTTIEGIIEKYIPGHDEFDLLPRYLELSKSRDFGTYGANGTLPVAFVASNHTTGGNSGSPVLNRDGHLVGINFDRAWESTMSDLMYDPERCRNIIVDIRYVLWVMDKYAGADHLIKEMTIIQ